MLSPFTTFASRNHPLPRHAKRRSPAVEQSEEIVVKAILKSNDIEPLERRLRFLVAPLRRKAIHSKLLISKRNREFLFSGGTQTGSVEILSQAHVEYKTNKAEDGILSSNMPSSDV